MNWQASSIASSSVEGIVIRCTCTAAQKLSPAWHGTQGLPCPQGQTVDLGVIAYWHANPLRRWAWRLSQFLRGQRAGTVKQGD